MSGWASILSAASALLGTLAGFWATARKRAEENAEMRGSSWRCLWRG